MTGKTDRELLELAAKACSYELDWGEVYKIGNEEFDCSDMPYVKSNSPDEAPYYWNPLTDDGDALRLAVKLNLDFYQGDDNGPAAYAGYFVGTRQKFATALHNSDTYAATRRAIVLAAAAVGKVMKEPS